MATEAGSGSRIGARLRAGREALGLTLLQAAEKLHVDPKILEWLEADRFDLLGASVYVRGHIKRYAELVRESSAELQALYVASSGTQGGLPDLTRIARAERTNNPRKLIVPTLVGLIGIALASAVWVVLRNVGVETDLQSRTARSPKDRGAGGDGSAGDGYRDGAGERERFGAFDAAPTDSDGADDGARTTGSRDGAAGREAGAGARSGATSPGGAAGASRPTASASQYLASGAAVSANAGSGAPVAAGPNKKLTLRFSADSWVEVYDASGKRLFFGMGTANTVRTMTGESPLRVVLGNAAGVSVEIDGRAESIPVNLRRKDTALFGISGNGQLVRPPPVARTEPLTNGG